MKGKVLIIFVAALLAAVTCTRFDFDYQKVHFSREGDYDVVEFSCVGGSDNYQYQFSSTPIGSFSSKNKVYFPRGRFNQNKYYGLKAIARDRVYGQTVKKTILFKISQDKIEECFGDDYNLDISNDDKINKIINQIRTIISQKPVINVGTYKFPQIKQVQTHVIKGDITYIRNVIDGAISSNQNCKQSGNFLSKLLSTTRAHISLLKINGETINAEIVAIEEELKFLQKQLQSRKSSYIDIKELNAKIVQFRKKIVTLQSERIKAESVIQEKQGSIKVSEQQIYEIKVITISGKEKEISEANTKISQIDIQISEIEKKLSILKQERVKYQKRRTEAKAIIEESTIKIKSINKLVISFQDQIRVAQIQINKVIQEIKTLHIRITDLQEEIKVGVDISIILAIQKKIAVQTKLIIGKKTILSNTKVTIERLEKNILTFEQIINKHYYSCYNIVEVQENNNQGNNVEVETDAFVSYLKQVFGYAPSSNFRVRFSGIGIQVPEAPKLHQTSIFSPVWIRNFGLPFSAGYGNNMDIMETEFSCDILEGQDNDLSVFDGKILNINKNFVTVRDSHGEDYTVHLGGCTRIETATNKELPQVGDNIYFKGKARKNEAKSRHYNGYHITCY